ncbi:hypothetical protein E4K10_48370 [Streptomyces sp. T1317-0309]|nr:hypothetical protein E4K10_48370 [Streptomyces sp. T1317-0309]
MSGTFEAFADLQVWAGLVGVVGTLMLLCPMAGGCYLAGRILVRVWRAGLRATEGRPVMRLAVAGAVVAVCAVLGWPGWAGADTEAAPGGRARHPGAAARGARPAPRTDHLHGQPLAHPLAPLPPSRPSAVRRPATVPSSAASSPAPASSSPATVSRTPSASPTRTHPTPDPSGSSPTPSVTGTPPPAHPHLHRPPPPRHTVTLTLGTSPSLPGPPGRGGT